MKTLASINEMEQNCNGNDTPSVASDIASYKRLSIASDQNSNTGDLIDDYNNHELLHEDHSNIESLLKDDKMNINQLRLASIKSQIAPAIQF